MKPASPVGIASSAWLRTRRWLLIAVGTLAVIAAVYLGISYFVVSSSLTTQRVSYEQTPADSGLVAEEIHFESAVDRIRLFGWLLRSSGDRAIVLVHGLNCYGWSGSQPDIARAYVKAGFHVLVFDLRGHGRSGGDLLGLGWHERWDVRAAVDLLLGRGFKPGRIGIHGGSYGAATALLATPVIPEVGAVVADSAFADMRDIMERQIEERTGVPSWLTKLFLRPGLALVAWLRYSLDFDAIAPERAVPEIAPRPILFIHGEKDRTIPVEHAHRLKAASRNPADELWILPLGHTEGVRRHGKECVHGEPSPMREAFLKKVTAFFDGSLR